MKNNKRKLFIFLFTLLFVIVAIVVNKKENLIIDETVYNVISNLHSKGMTVFFKIITRLGNAKFIGCICILLLSLNKTRDKIGIPITISVAISGILNVILKNIFQRPRPLLEQLVHEESFSFPSGHSMVTAVIYSMFIYLSCKYIKNKKVKISVNVVCSLLIFLIGISRIYLRVHYFSDVLAGWSLGIILTLVYSIVSDKIIAKKNLENNE